MSIKIKTEVDDLILKLDDPDPHPRIWIWDHGEIVSVVDFNTDQIAKHKYRKLYERVKGSLKNENSGRTGDTVCAARLNVAAATRYGELRKSRETVGQKGYAESAAADGTGKWLRR